MSTSAKRRYTVAIQKNGQLINPLTENEQYFLEDILQMERGSLSVYKRENNFWKNRFVELVKGDNFLDLSSPYDYINYKIILTNKDFVAPSEESLRKYHKHTYQFVVTTDANELENSILELNSKAKAYKLYSEIESDFVKLSYLCEKIAGKYIHVGNKELILDAINKIILTNTQKFISELENKFLDTEILLKKAIDKGAIRKQKSEYILSSHNLTLCAAGLNPTLKTACEFLNMPKNQEYLLELQALVND
jgi:hypothetical protein